jgi:hypothetical protein
MKGFKSLGLVLTTTLPGWTGTVNTSLQGNLVASSASGTSSAESVSIPRPAAGTYRVQLKGFLNGPTNYTGTAEVDQLVPLP